MEVLSHSIDELLLEELLELLELDDFPQLSWQSELLENDGGFPVGFGWPEYFQQSPDVWYPVMTLEGLGGVPEYTVAYTGRSVLSHLKFLPQPWKHVSSVG